MKCRVMGAGGEGVAQGGGRTLKVPYIEIACKSMTFGAACGGEGTARGSMPLHTIATHRQNRPWPDAALQYCTLQLVTLPSTASSFAEGLVSYLLAPKVQHLNACGFSVSTRVLSSPCAS